MVRELKSISRALAPQSDEDNESLFHSIVETIREPILVLDQRLVVELANQAFYRVFAASPTETEGQRIYALGSGQWNIPALRLLLERILPEQSSFDGFEVEHEFPRIGRKTMLLNARRVINATAGPRILLVIEDITERKILEHERDAALSAREELVAVVSHELKNPLTTITSSLDLLDRTLAAPDGLERNRRLLGQIRGATHRMGRITADLLDVTKIEAGRLMIHKTLVDLGALAQEVLESFKPAAAEKRIQLESAVPPNMKSLSCDRDRIFQVLANLMGNAIKFTGEGGRVRLELDQLKNQIRFRITDTGCGIPKEQLGHIFERFWQAKHAQYLGSGLGLYISKSLIEAHNGRIGLESQPGRGSTFYFTLPGGL